MAEDIVARLRQAGRCLDGHICSTCDREVRDDMGCTCACHDYLWGDAADEIERLRAELNGYKHPKPLSANYGQAILYHD